MIGWPRWAGGPDGAPRQRAVYQRRPSRLPAPPSTPRRVPLTAVGWGDRINGVSPVLLEGSLTVVVRRFLPGFAVLAACLPLAGQPADVFAFVQARCVACHSATSKSGDLDFTALRTAGTFESD